MQDRGGLIESSHCAISSGNPLNALTLIRNLGLDDPFFGPAAARPSQRRMILRK
jgi:hypothetical protein